VPAPRSIDEIDLRPKPGKRYWSVDREWREEIIYFLMVDRFHDGRERRHAPYDAARRPSAERLRRFCGGRLEGLRRNLDYVAGLGCTAVWLSPVFENDPRPEASSYHGYGIWNYLAVDPRFGSAEDLASLVDAAHERGMRVFLDAVANHAGDVWAYPGDHPYFYSEDGARFPIGAWRSPDRPLPIELRSDERYYRRGQIRDSGWDAMPESQLGDFFSLKGFDNGEEEAGRETQRILVECHKYWVREADIDGYRMDAVKHMGVEAIAHFCQELREYAYSLGKREFFLFGELVAGDEAIDRYAGPSAAPGGGTVDYGLDSVLDFPLYWSLPGVIKGFDPPGALMARYDGLRARGMARGELGNYLVGFVDNHDQIGQSWKRRFAAGARPEQVAAGEGPGDELLREPLFDLDDPGLDCLDPSTPTYRKIAALAALHREEPALRFGRMYFREVSGNGADFGFPSGQPCTLAFSRILAGDEILVAYNSSTSERRSDWIIVDPGLQRPGEAMRCLHGAMGDAVVQRVSGGAAAVRLDLEPMGFAVFAGRRGR
jgi:hypothetical protein